MNTRCLMLWIVRVFAMATLSAPVMVSGQEPFTLPASSMAPRVLQQGDDQPGVVQQPVYWTADRVVHDGGGTLAGSDFAPTTHSGDFDTFPSSSFGPVAPAPCYWIASSRELPQVPTTCGSSRLEYFHRLPNGCLQSTSREAMTGQFTPGMPICIFIHGSFVDVPSHRKESAETYNWIRRACPHLPAHMLFYTWPSEAMCNMVAPLNPHAVNERGRWAESNAFYLADLIAHLPANSPICFVGHSHGARVTIATLHLLAGGQIDGRTFPDNTCCRRYRAVLAAAAMDRHWLNPGKRYDLAIHKTEGILNLVNRTDGALHFYPFRLPFISRKAIAVTGLTRWDRARLGAAGHKLIDYEVSDLIGLGHFWPNYFEEPSLGRLISPYVYFTDAQLRPTYALAR